MTNRVAMMVPYMLQRWIWAYFWHKRAEIAARASVGENLFYIIYLLWLDIFSAYSEPQGADRDNNDDLPHHAPAMMWNLITMTRPPMI